MSAATFVGEAVDSSVASTRVLTMFLWQYSAVTEKVNIELPNACSSIEGHKYVVHTTLQEKWGQVKIDSF